VAAFGVVRTESPSGRPIFATQFLEMQRKSAVLAGRSAELMLGSAVDKREE